MSNQLVAPKLEQILHLKMKIETKTGLLISAGRAIGRIGGVDVESMSVEREYLCNDNTRITARVPYIPGSSLKGRMRSLLELSLGLPLYSTDKKIWAHTPSVGAHKTLPTSDESDKDKLNLEEFLQIIDKYKINKLFGYSSFRIEDLEDLIKKQEPGRQNESQQSKIDISIVKKLTPTLFLVDDFFVETEYVCNIYQRNGIVSFDDFVEEKSENRIDRITSMADPRAILRVKPGIKFEGKVSLLIFENIRNELKEYLGLLLNGLYLVEATYLGASGSRGYGRVKFVDIQISSTKIVGNTVSETGVPVKQMFEDLDDLKNNLESVIGAIQTSKGT